MRALCLVSKDTKLEACTAGQAGVHSRTVVPSLGGFALPPSSSALSSVYNVSDHVTTTKQV
jgi:hypothetical protein